MRSRLIVLVVMVVALASVSLRQAPVQASPGCPNVVNQGLTNGANAAAECATVAGGRGNAGERLLRYGGWRR